MAKHRKNSGDNLKLAKLVMQDQQEREHFFDNPEQVTANDAKRRKVVTKLIRNGKLRTWKDHFNAALIFQHGLTDTDYRMAHVLAKKSVEIANKKWSRWLYALTTDRLLVSQGKKQKYGSQFQIVDTYDKNTGRKKKILKIHPYDKRTSDKTREWHGLPPLKELLKRDGKSLTKPKKTPRIDLDDD